jgi:acyl carrier protein
MNDLLSEKDANVVMEILVRELGVAEAQLTNDARLEEDLGADSLTRITISMALEDRFGITIPDEGIERIATVGDIFELLAELLRPPA